jgi:CDP-paratose 2-epimerase
MTVAIVTGSAGLIGSEAVKLFASKGLDVVGIDNNLRRYFFGDDASTLWRRDQLKKTVPRYKHVRADIRNEAVMEDVFAKYGKDIAVVIHTAAQPSHDWAGRNPLTDFDINTKATVNLLELTRKHCPNAPFIFCSSSKVYGDSVNRLPLIELESRWEMSPAMASAYDYDGAANGVGAAGINEFMSIDHSTHSLLGASKAAADIMVQEYGRYYGMKTVCFRCGCLTGPGHSGTELHGFLSYLMKCAVSGKPYSIMGYKGKQVRDNIHSYDLVNAFWHFFQGPGWGEVYNIGGSRYANCSILEAIEQCEALTVRKLNTVYVDTPRLADHIWYISDVRKFQSHYPDWQLTYGIPETLTEMHDAMKGT